MRTLLLSAAVIAASLSASAQCDRIFISEYVVGTGNNKAYELYNPTSEPIDLNGYILERWSNGEQGSTDQTNLTGTIEAYGTWVVANGQTEDIDLGTFISPACDPELQGLANQLDNPYPAPTFMNGNDALVLTNASLSPPVLDIFGKPGEDPGQAWTAPDGTFITSNQTMVRKFDITGGLLLPPATFVPLADWDTLGTDVWTNLGIHDCACFPLSNENQVALDVQVFPNPLVGNAPMTVTTNKKINDIEVFDMTGRLIATEVKTVNAEQAEITFENLPAGTYIINVKMEGAVGFSTRFIKQ
ncbi:MAG: lamin tail domain-containing protein [Cryomorphaceae bacterium]